MLALGLELSPGVVLLVVIASGIAVAPPQAPGIIGGPFQLAVMVVAETFQVPKGQAGAMGLLVWLVNVLPITLVGLGFLWYEGLSLKKLAAASGELRQEPTPDG